MCLPRSGELAPSKRPLVTRGVALIYLGRVLIQSQLVTANLINVRFGPLCGLKSDISRGPRSANNGYRRWLARPPSSARLSARDFAELSLWNMSLVIEA